MELDFITRGKSDEVYEFAKWLSTRHLPLKVKKADGTEETMLMECQLRPIQLWTFVFPKENLDIVLNTLHLPHDSKGDFPGYNINPKLFALRKLLGSKPIPEPVDKTSTMFMPFDRFKHVGIIGVGLREDGDIAEMTHERI